MLEGLRQAAQVAIELGFGQEPVSDWIFPIATRLSLRVKIVQNEVPSSLRKLQVADRAQIIVRAREAGLGAQS